MLWEKGLGDGLALLDLIHAQESMTQTQGVQHEVEADSYY